MSSNPANEQLSAYLDGELEDAEAASIEAALAGDAELRAQLDRLKGVQRLLRTHGRARAPEGFADRVIAAASEEADNVVAFPFWRRPFGIPVEGVLVAAAAALVLIVALPRSTESPAEGPAVETPAMAAPDGKPAEAKGSGEGAAVSKDGPAKTDGIADAGTDGAYAGTDDADAKPAPKALSKGTAPTSAPSPKPAPSKKEALPQDASLGGEADADAGDQGGLAGSGSMDNAATPEGTTGDEGTSSKVVDARLTAAGLSGELYTDDEAVLGQIQAIVARYDGRIVDLDGNEVTGGVLPPGETQLFLEIPQEHMSTVNTALRQLGGRIDTTNNALAGSADFKLPLRIVVSANAPSTGADAAPNAARQKQRSYDEAEAIDQ